MRYNLKIQTAEYGTIDGQIWSIDKDRKEFENCDSNGLLVKKIVEQKEVAHYENSEGKIVPKEQIVKLINGKPASKLSKTKVVSKYDIVSSTEAQDLLKEHYYQFVSSTPSAEKLLEFLGSNGKALKFTFSNGNGYKVYQAYLINYQGVFVIVLGYGYLTEQIEPEAIVVSREEKKKATKLVAEATIENLM